MNGIFGNLQKRVVERVERVPRVVERICVQCRAGRGWILYRRLYVWTARAHDVDVWMEI